MGSSESQGSMAGCPGQNAGALCRLCCIQGPTPLSTWKSILNKTILLLQNPPKTLKMHYDLQGSWTFNFHPVYEMRLFLLIKENQSWSFLTLLTPRAALYILQSLPPHLHISFFSVFNMCHSLKSLGDKFAGTPDENTCRIIFNTGSFHISSSLHRKKKKKDKPGLKIFA